MSLQTDIKLLFPKFIEDCNQLLPDGAADSGRCTGLCAHYTYRSTTPACTLFADDCEGTMDTWLSKFEFPGDILSGSDARSVFESIIWSQKQFLNLKKVKREKIMGQLTGSINKGVPSFRKMLREYKVWLEDIFSIYCNWKSVHTHVVCDVLN